MSKYLLSLAVFFGLYAAHAVWAAPGDVVWTRTFDDPVSTTDWVWDSVLSDSGFYTVGLGRIENRSPANGALIWGYNTAPASEFSGVAVDSTGVYTVGWDKDDQIMIKKINLNTGVVIWSQVSNPSATEDEAMGVAVDATGVYVIGGQDASGDERWRIEKRSLATGALLWSQTSNYTPLSFEKGYGIGVNPTGVYVTGIVADGMWHMEKRSLATGALLWSQTSDPGPGLWNAAHSVAVDGTGVYFGGKGQGLRIEKRSLATGALLWSTPSAAQDGVIQDMVINSNGDLVVGGTLDYSVPIVQLRNGSDGTVEWSKIYPPGGFLAQVGGIGVDATGVYAALTYNSIWRIEKLESNSVVPSVDLHFE